MPVAIDPDLGLDVATDAVARAVKAGADAAQVNHVYYEGFEVNFDTNDVTLVRSVVGDTLNITVFDGTRKGSTEVTGRSHDLIDAAVAQALEAAKAGEVDPANVLPDEPAQPAANKGPEAADQEAMVDAVLRHIEWTKKEYPLLRTDSSHYSFVTSWSSYANSHDRVQHARRGRYTVTLVMTGKEDTKATSFNYVSQLSFDPFDEIGAVPAVRRLFDNTMASFDARSVPSTFVGDVIFTPESLGTAVSSVAGALGGISLMRKTTPYLDRLGERIAAPSFSMLHRPSVLPGASSFDGDGFPNTDIDLIRDGVLENFAITWYFSHKLGRPRTTGALDLMVPGGDTPLDEIIASTERGIVLGRYSGGMPNQNLDFSGVAKNSFYVEDGKIVHPLSETMVAGNFASVLESITAVSRETIDFGTSIFPWVKSTGVTISTK